MIRVQLPVPLRRLVGVRGVVELEVAPPVTQRALLDALERRFPALRGTIRDQATQRRRPLLRFHACGVDLSDHGPDEPLPEAVIDGDEPFVVVAAVAGG